MCIRDRADGRDRVGVENAGLQKSDPAVEFKIVHSEQPLGTVSYTHLRAHETVLDLVCRLLLEKKKTREKDPCKNN